MAYWDVKVLVLVATPERHKSQPTGFSGLREATMAPTVTSITIVELPSHQSKSGCPGESGSGPGEGGSAPSAPRRAPTATRQARRWHGGLSHRFLYSVPLHLLSQHHSTAPPSAKRYGNRYEVACSVNFGELRLAELRRIPILRSRVNRSRERTGTRSPGPV